MTNYVQLSRQLLSAVKKETDHQPFLEKLRRTNFDEMARQLNTDQVRKAVWINFYNAFSQILLKQHLNFYRKNRMGFFSKKWIDVGGKRLSLNNIEHGLLRRSQFTYGFGYLANPFPSAWERRFRVQRRDVRVHFALNCGAAACPPILFYRPEVVDQQLETATIAFLESDCRLDSVANVVEVSRIFQWFTGDFGGKTGVFRLLVRYGVLAPGSAPKLVFRPYDWSLSLGKFASSESSAAG
ncbi:MAG: DUF547 domain-containing protein [Cytophagaceae bacterium]|nr:DUF547 domain-containing protein [Cytophagaceae bacterium]